MMRRAAFPKQSALLIGVGVAVLALTGVLVSRHSSTAAPPATVPAEWLDDLHPAEMRAQSEGKDILVEFAAPENFPASARSIDASLLGTENFRRLLGDNFVLVRLSSSNATSAARLAQLTARAQKLGIERFPTFVLMDATGKAYARSELIAATAEAYRGEFRRLQQVRARRDEALAQAATAKGGGLDEAILLDRALAAVAPFADADYVELERRIVELDPQNAAGLKSKYQPRLVVREIDTVIQAEIYPLVDRANYRGAIARIDRLVAELKPPRPELQLLVAFKGQLHYSLGDKRRAARFLDEAIAIDPRSASAEKARAAKLQLAAIP